MGDQPAPPPATLRRRRLRRFATVVLVIAACVLAPLSVLALWTKTTVLDTANYVAAVSPLARNRDIQEAAATRVTKRVASQGNLASRVEKLLPPRLAAKANRRAAAESVVHEAALRIVSSEQFAKLWDEANRRIQPQLVAALTGETTRGVSVRSNGAAHARPVHGGAARACPVVEAARRGRQCSGTSGCLRYHDRVVPIVMDRLGPGCGEPAAETRLVAARAHLAVLRGCNRPVDEPAPHGPAVRARYLGGHARHPRCDRAGSRAVPRPLRPTGGPPGGWCGLRPTTARPPARGPRALSSRPTDCTGCLDRRPGGASSRNTPRGRE